MSNQISCDGKNYDLTLFDMGNAQTQNGQTQMQKFWGGQQQDTGEIHEDNHQREETNRTQQIQIPFQIKYQMKTRRTGMMQEM